MKHTWDYSGIVEMTINRPVNDVWPYFVDITKEERWREQHYTRIAGEPGKVGEIYMQTAPDGEQMFMEVITVKPGKQLVLKMTLRENEKSESKLIGYDFHTFNEVAGHTTVVLQQAVALPADYAQKYHLDNAAQDKMLAHIYQNLKRMVEDSQ